MPTTSDRITTTFTATISNSIITTANPVKYIDVRLMENTGLIVLDTKSYEKQRQKLLPAQL
jgi:hypothetical protein